MWGSWEVECYAFHSTCHLTALLPAAYLYSIDLIKFNASAKGLNASGCEHLNFIFPESGIFKFSSITLD